MANIRDILSARKAEIKALQAQLKQELQDIIAAESAMSPISDKEPTIKLRKGRGSQFTLKDMVINVLRDYRSGADALKILELIKSKYGIDVKRESLSPQLSRLKNDDKLLELRGSDWFLIPQKNEAPRGASMVGEIAVSPNSNASDIDDLL
jgi:hypothetical protein